MCALRGVDETRPGALSDPAHISIVLGHARQDIPRLVYELAPLPQ